jgi:uncharacterized protein
MTMEPRISAITLGVNDMAAAQRFYQAMGWTPHPTSQEAVTFYQANGMVLCLFGRDALAQDAHIKDTQAGFGGMTLAYNVRTKDEVAFVLAQAEKTGGKILKPAQDVFWGGHSGYFADPDGHVWEVAHNPFWTVQDNGAVTL